MRQLVIRRAVSRECVARRDVSAVRRVVFRSVVVCRVSSKVEFKAQRNLGAKHWASAVNAVLSSLLLCAVLAGCSKDKATDPTLGLSKATIGEPRTEPTPGPATYQFSNKDSIIAFVGSNLVGNQEGKFGSFNGAITAPDSDPGHATVSLIVDVASIQTSNADLTKHLLSADFLDAAKYPKLKFTSTAISPDKQGFLIDGVLEMRGVKKQVTFPTELTLPPNAPSAKAQFLLDRQAFGVAFKGAPDNLIRDEVVVRLEIKTQPATTP